MQVSFYQHFHISINEHVGVVLLYEQINKQNDQMFTLLAICLVLHPICIDETIYSHLREKYADRMLKMQKGSVLLFFVCYSIHLTVISCITRYGIKGTFS